MKTFNTFMNESRHYVSGGFNIARSEMPQIKDQEKFLQYIESLGVEVMTLDISPAIIKPTQVDYDQAKVDAIGDAYLDPIVISDDFYILDGHHRYFAAVQADRAYIKVHYVATGINRLLKHAYDHLGDNND